MKMNPLPTSNNETNAVDSNCASQAREVEPEVLPEDYKLQPYDVLSGRGKAAFNNVGNRRFRVTLTMAVDRYKSAPRRKEKTMLINSIVEITRSNGGRFLSRKNGRWVEIGDRVAREKVAHAMRDMVNGPDKRQQKQQDDDDGSLFSSLASLPQIECETPHSPLPFHEASEASANQADTSHHSPYATRSRGKTDEFERLIGTVATPRHAGRCESPSSESYESFT